MKVSNDLTVIVIEQSKDTTPFIPVSSTEDDDSCTCNKIIKCVTGMVWFCGTGILFGQLIGMWGGETTTVSVIGGIAGAIFGCWCCAKMG
ncbi:MAG: hypothetical protein KR126chlam6_00553 [Candidatus Anoxychlamydiales bacterium]|nr:hypothetical protein [Candidatus Anoxychlamydiales bacterium]